MPLSSQERKTGWPLNLSIRARSRPDLPPHLSACALRSILQAFAVMAPNGDQPQTIRKSRPVSVSFAAVSMGLNAAVCAVAAFFALNSFRLHFRQTHFLTVGLLFGALAFVFASVTQGLWKLSSSARRVAVILAVFDILSRFGVVTV